MHASDAITGGKVKCAIVSAPSRGLSAARLLRGNRIEALAGTAKHAPARRAEPDRRSHADDGRDIFGRAEINRTQLAAIPNPKSIAPAEPDPVLLIFCHCDDPVCTA